MFIEWLDLQWRSDGLTDWLTDRHVFILWWSFELNWDDFMVAPAPAGGTRIWLSGPCSQDSFSCPNACPGRAELGSGWMALALVSGGEGGRGNWAWSRKLVSYVMNKWTILACWRAEMELGFYFICRTTVILSTERYTTFPFAKHFRYKLKTNLKNSCECASFRTCKAFLLPPCSHVSLHSARWQYKKVHCNWAECNWTWIIWCYCIRSCQRCVSRNCPWPWIVAILPLSVINQTILTGYVMCFNTVNHFSLSCSESTVCLLFASI